MIKTAIDWHIIGFGAVGQLLHGQLQAAGLSVAVLPRTGRTLATEHTVHSLRGDIKRYAIAATDPSHNDTIRRLLVCTKSFQVTQALADISHRLNESSEVILVNNGMIDRANLTPLIQGARLLFGLNTSGAYRADDYEVVQAGQGQLRLGPGAEPDWFGRFQAAVPDSSWIVDIEPYRWQKLAINAVINPLTALHNCLNGDLELERHSAQTQDLIDELVMLLAHQEFKEIAQTFNQECWRVIQQTSRNRSSMNQDIAQQRPTEIEFILKPWLRYAGEHQLAVPHLTQLYDSFRARFLPIGSGD